jgi:hypothetical protein
VPKFFQINLTTKLINIIIIIIIKIIFTTSLDNIPYFY